MRLLKAAAGPALCFLVFMVLQYKSMSSDWAKVQMDRKIPAKGRLVQGTLTRFETRTFHTGGRINKAYDVDVPVVQFTTAQGQQMEHLATEYGYWVYTNAKPDLRIGQVVPIYYLLSPTPFARVEQWHTNRDDYVYLSIDVFCAALAVLVMVVMTRRALREAE